MIPVFFYLKYFARNKRLLLLCSITLFILSPFGNKNTLAQDQEDIVAFEIVGFEVEGNTLLTKDIMVNILTPFTGKSKVSGDVEKARDALESFYHKAGYPAVLVNIPQQIVEEGLVRLTVTESRIGEVRIRGNRYFTRESILKRFPSLSPGEIIYIPRIQQEFGLANRNPDIKISPLLIPSKEMGLIDVELKVDDKLPLHGSLDLNNRSSHNTTDIRLNGSIRYDNLWQKEHSLSIQYQTSPENTGEVKLMAGSYLMPAPWNTNHMVALYTVWSDSETAFGEDFDVIGKGSIYGLRYIIPLPSLDNLFHNVTLGLDYKDFDEDINFTDTEQEGLKTPVRYLPLLCSYSATQSDSMGKTQFSFGLNMVFRNIVTDQREFEIKRRWARGDYLYWTANIERMHKLPLGLELYAKLDGQVASEPLITNEQYTAGGMESVRGYKESELSGDHALHGTIELFFPELVENIGLKNKMTATLYYFYDMARLWKKRPSPGEEKYMGLRGGGFGVKGTLYKGLEYQFDWAMAFEDTNNVQMGNDRYHFRIKYGF